ncbi:MAG TPA: CARDB domain-containing protein [archaeon]|nr:CARDB domain-containing protein [archaeon]
MSCRSQVKLIFIWLLITSAVLAAAQVDLAVTPVPRVHKEVIKGPKAEFTIDVSGQTPPVNRSIEITGPAEDVRIKVDGALDFSSIKALANSLTKNSMTDEEKVKACFYFAINSLYDRGSRGCDDPLEYISIYGYSYCGNFALFLNALWKALGFPTVFLNPVIRMPSGHTITAVYYDNQWHMYDSRLRGYFLNWDNRTVASLIDLDRDDNLIRRALDYDNRLSGHWDFFTIMTNYYNAASDWYDGFNSHFDNLKLFNRDCPQWDGRLSLRAGEKLTLNWTNQGKWWNRKDLSPHWLRLHPSEGREAMTVPPVIYANGTLETRIDPAMYKSQAHDFSGIRAKGGKSPVFQPSGVNDTGYVIYRIRAPYFIPSIKIEAAGFRGGTADHLSIDISTDEGKTWATLWQPGETGAVRAKVSTEETQRVTWYEPHKYSYLLRFSLRAERTASDAALGSIRILTDLFYRPMILPPLKKGINRVFYSDRSRGSHERRVTYNWLEDTNILFSEDRPAEGDSITLTALVQNRGDSPANNVAVRFYDGHPARGGVKIGMDQVIDEIAPGGTVRAGVGWYAVQRQVDASSGFSIARSEKMVGYTHNTIFVQVDPEDRIPESDENNNLTSRDLTVYNKANLVLIHPSFVTFERRGDKVLLSAMVRNQNLYGFLPRAREARNVMVRFYNKQPNVSRLDENMIGEAVIPAIPAGEFGIARVEWDVTGLTGHHRVYVVVDPEDRIPEKWQQEHGKYMQIKKDIFL